MYISIRGGSRSQKKYVKSMVEFCVSKMMPRMRNLEFEINLKNFGRDDSWGYCIPADHADPYRPRAFEFDINKQAKLRRLLETVAHEMVHAKQFAKGELFESTTNKHRWKGRYLKKEPSYWDQPWEIEAHGRECGLFVQWAEHHKLGHLKWTHDK
jgi:hypothetical protein